MNGIGDKIKSAFKKYRSKKKGQMVKAGKENKRRKYIQDRLKKGKKDGCANCGS